MKKIIYGLLIATSIAQSSVFASQHPTLKTDKSVCPDQLNMTQLNELKQGSLKLGGLTFTVHTSKEEFKEMLPANWRIFSKNSSHATIEDKGRTIITSGIKGHVLTCKYTFQKTVGITQTPFTIVSEPQEGKPLPEGLVEAIGRS